MFNFLKSFSKKAGFVPPASAVHTQQFTAQQAIVDNSAWREAYNPLYGFSPRRVTEMVDEYNRGAQTNLQWLLKWIEDEDAIYRAMTKRFRSAISSLEWTVAIPKDLTGPQLAMAEEQQKKLNELYNGMCSLRKSIEATAMAQFTGCSFLEKTITKKGLCLAVVEPWFFVRNGSRGPWNYNESLTMGVTDGIEIDRNSFVIREHDHPIGRIACRLFAIKNISIKDWLGYVETYGIPAIFALLPPGIAQGEVERFQNIVNSIISRARGTLPAGATIETVESKRTGDNPFLQLADWCDKQLVIAGTGGMLTMLAESGSGTLAGSAHMEAWRIIAEGEAVLVSEVFQEQVDQPFLADVCPGQPVYAYWKLSPAVRHDPGEVIKHVAELRKAGYKVRREQVIERTGYDLEEVEIASPAIKPELDEGDRPIKNRAGDDPSEIAANDPRRVIAAAFNEDFEGIRAVFKSLLDTDKDSPEYAALTEKALSMWEAIVGAEPGTLNIDSAFEELAAAGLLDGWSK